MSSGVSLAINAAILGIMVRVLAGPSKPAETLIEVELSAPSPIHATRIEPPEPKTVVVPAAPQPPREKPKPARSLLPKLDLSRLFGVPQPKKAEAPRADDAHPRPDPKPSRSDDRPRVETPSTGGNAGGPAGSGHGDRTTSSGGGGTALRGPGAPSAPGNGGGGGTLVGGNGGSKSIVNVPAPAPHQPEPRRNEPAPAKPEPPAPKGESHSARAVKQPDPAYPSDARDDGVEGTVVLIAGVDTNGRVSEVRIEKGSGDRRLDKAAEKAVRQWAYSPALKDGVAVKTSVRVRVEFKLE